MTPAIRKRLDRLEAQIHVGTPTKVLAFRPLEPGEAAEALRDWRTWTSDGRAYLHGDVLVIPVSVLSVEEWKASVARYRERLH